MFDSKNGVFKWTDSLTHQNLNTWEYNFLLLCNDTKMSLVKCKELSFVLGMKVRWSECELSNKQPNVKALREKFDEFLTNNTFGSC